MFWKLTLAAAALMTASVASAQFVGPGVRGQTTTAAQVDQARVGSYVTLTGNVVSHLRRDFYTFQDSSGQIRVEISPEVFAGRQVKPETQVRILGEIDTGLAGRYVWVKSLEVVN